MSKIIKLLCITMLLGIAGSVGCATAPKSHGEQRDLAASADDTLSRMVARDPGLQPLLDQSAGYAVFPEIGKGALIVGGEHGRGVLYEHGRMVGYVQVNEASLGLQAGAKSFSELVILHDADALARIKGDKFSVGANVSAVALTSGAAAAAQFEDGVAVFVDSGAGLMVDVSVGGQRIDFEPAA